MYQVFDASDIYRPPPLPPSDDDFTLQRRFRDPDEGGGGGGGIDDVLGWLGIPSPGGSRAGYDDPGGGFSSWGPAGLRALDETGLGQLMMETDNEDADYFDYSCLSSGLMSPDVESEFFNAHCAGRQLPFRAPEPTSWSFNPSCTTLPDRPPSPLFGDFRFNAGSDSSYPEMTSCDRYDDLPFDSEAQAKVKEIARYLASFEVQPWSVGTHRSLTSSCSTPGSNPTSPFQELGPVSGSTSPNQPNRTNITSSQKVSAAPVGFFHAGFDDSCCGLETTMVNPNEVFPDRTDVFPDPTDHQYASSRPTRDHPPRGRPTPRSSQRTSPHSVTPPKGRASSVLEALLRSTEPIDPNKGSGAAVAMEDEDEDEGEEGQWGVGRRTPERSLKKLLTGRVANDDDLSRKSHRGRADESLRAAAAPKKMISPAVETEMVYRASGGTSGRIFPGFADVKQKTNVIDESELARELGEIIREQTARKSNAGYTFTSEFRSAECFRCN